MCFSALKTGVVYSLDIDHKRSFPESLKVRIEHYDHGATKTISFILFPEFGESIPKEPNLIQPPCKLFFKFGPQVGKVHRPSPILSSTKSTLASKALLVFLPPPVV